MISVVEEKNEDVCIILGIKKHIKLKLLGKEEKKYFLVNDKGKIKIIPLKEKGNKYSL